MAYPLTLPFPQNSRPPLGHPPLILSLSLVLFILSLFPLFLTSPPFSPSPLWSSLYLSTPPPFVTFLYYPLSVSLISTPSTLCYFSLLSSSLYLPYFYSSPSVIFLYRPLSVSLISTPPPLLLSFIILFLSPSFLLLPSLSFFLYHPLSISLISIPPPFPLLTSLYLLYFYSSTLLPSFIIHSLSPLFLPLPPSVSLLCLFHTALPLPPPLPLPLLFLTPFTPFRLPPPYLPLYHFPIRLSP